MKFLSETIGMRLLTASRETLRDAVSVFEKKAKSCATCDTRGICCTDVHFVNVRITRLEAKAIGEKIESLPRDLVESLKTRTREMARKMGDDRNPDFNANFYACPLFDAEAGCSVHEVKPGACITHACYERKSDLPPSEALEAYESDVSILNKRVYGRDVVPLPIPKALTRLWTDSRPLDPTANEGDWEQQAQEDRMKPDR